MLWRQIVNNNNDFDLNDLAGQVQVRSKSDYISRLKSSAQSQKRKDVEIN